MSTPLTVTVIMPALNEERDVDAAITATLSAFDGLGIAGDVIVINDGSADRTLETVRGVMARDPRVGVITHARPMGIGASFWDGVDSAQGDIVTMFPGDNENDPYEALRYFGLLGHVDMIIPFVYNKEVRSLFRNALSFAYRFIINTTFLVYFNYTNGTVLYRKSMLRELPYRSTGFFFQTDILVRTVKQGYLFAEVPYKLSVRASGKSKAVSFPSLVNVVKGYVRLVRDIYFSKEGRLPRTFTADSQSSRRYGEAQKEGTRK